MASISHISAHISSHTLQIGNFLDHKQMITSLITIEKLCSSRECSSSWNDASDGSDEFIKASVNSTTKKNVSTNDKRNWIFLSHFIEWKRKFPRKSGMNYCTINFKLSYHLGAFVPRILFSCEICSGPV